MSAQREAFEARARAVTGALLRLNPDRSYFSGATREDWEEWQAAWQAAQAAVVAPPNARVADLAMLVRQLVRTLRKAAPDSEAGNGAMGYLARHGLTGSPLREEIAPAAAVVAPGATPAPAQGAATPMQPIEPDPEGVIRFRCNRIVIAVYEKSRRHGYGMNEIHTGDFTGDERRQFAQLLGYSVSGYGTLQYVSAEDYDRATAPAPAPVAQWIRVTDRLPADGAEVLVWPRPDDEVPTASHSAAGGWFSQYEDEVHEREPTHWMPLPAGPAPADAGEVP